MFGGDAYAMWLSGIATGPEMGALVGWGGGRTAATEAIARTAQITPEVVEDMRAAGLTKRMVFYWRNVYVRASANDREGSVAPARLNLMDTILNNW